MEADFSEFSYGYAAIREAESILDGVYTSAGAPVLPSLIKEEKLGWDVHLAYVEYALFLQFKRSSFVSRRHPSSPTWPGVGSRHYRYSIDTDGHQHQALLKLENDLSKSAGSGNVYYAAPMFHGQDEFDKAYSAGAVLSRSKMILPSELGDMTGTHHFTSTVPGVVKILSEPREAESVSWEQIVSRARDRASPKETWNIAARQTLGELDELVGRSVQRLERKIPRSYQDSVVERLHRSAAILGCGLALVITDPGID
ncbi:MAG: hypothetical protein JWO68_4279 [Actinomycetia bacterium]|nr:hypothetical protein [Actinomycetes bacterium]